MIQVIFQDSNIRWVVPVLLMVNDSENFEIEERALLPTPDTRSSMSSVRDAGQIHDAIGEIIWAAEETFFLKHVTYQLISDARWCAQQVPPLG